MNWRASSLCRASAVLMAGAFLALTGCAAAPSYDQGSMMAVKRKRAAEMGYRGKKARKPAGMLAVQVAEEDEAPARVSPQAFLAAAAQGQESKVDQALSEGVDVNSKNLNGATALQLAAAGGYLTIVQSLIANGADVNAADNNGTTPLMAAAIGGFDEVARALKAAGAKSAKPAPAATGGENGTEWWKQR